MISRKVVSTILSFFQMIFFHENFAKQDVILLNIPLWLLKILISIFKGWRVYVWAWYAGPVLYTEQEDSATSCWVGYSYSGIGRRHSYSEIGRRHSIYLMCISSSKSHNLSLIVVLLIHNFSVSLQKKRKRTCKIFPWDV